MRNKINSRALMPAITAGLMAVAAVLGFAGSAQAAASVCDAIAGNLVTNCGFETGDFTGWTQSTTSPFPEYGVENGGSVSGAPPNSGTYSAYFGSTNCCDMISQSVSTIAGDTYSITFWLDITGSSPPPPPDTAQFTAMFGSTSLLSLTDPPGTGFYEAFTDTVAAAGSSTTLSFSGYNVNNFFDLDDVSVTLAPAPVPVPVPALPKPAALILLATGLVGLKLIEPRKKA